MQNKSKSFSCGLGLYKNISPVHGNMPNCHKNTKKTRIAVFVKISVMMIIIQTVAIVIKVLAELLCAFRLHYLRYLFELIRRVEEKSRANLNYHWPVIFVFIFSFLSFTFFLRSSGIVNSICQIYRFLLKFFSFISNIIISFEKNLRNFTYMISL